MTRAKAVSRILLACLMFSLLAVACSRADSSDWVGATPLQEALTNGKPTVVEFGASTCVPCKAMRPVLEEIIADYGDRLNLSFTDIRVNPRVAEQHGITLMPTQIFFDAEGQEVSRHVGFWPKGEVLAHLEELGFL